MQRSNLGLLCGQADSLLSELPEPLLADECPPLAPQRVDFQPALVVQQIKDLPAVWETWVWSPGWEDPLEKGMTTHSGILACRIPCTV